MKINEETTVSEEQVLFNKLRYEYQELIIKIMKSLQPCKLSCEVEEEKKIPEKINYPHIEIESSADDEIRDYLYKVKDKIDEIIDYLKSKGE